MQGINIQDLADKEDEKVFVLKKALIISYRLPPAKSGSAIVLQNLMQQFNQEEFLIVGAKEYALQNTDIGFDRPRIKFIAWRPPAFKGAGILMLLQLPLSLIMILFYYFKNRCKQILVVYPHHHYLLIGWLASVITISPFYSYFHNTFVENLSGNKLKKIIYKVIQYLVFKRSRAIFVISDGLKGYYEKKHPNMYKFITLRHSFNEDIPEVTPTLAVKPLKFAFTGNINSANNDATRRLFNAVTKIENSEIYLTTSTPKMQIEKYGINIEKLRLTPSLSREELLDHLSSMDALLLPHGFEGDSSLEDYQTIFPTKTIEYLLSAKPIIAHCKNDTFLHHFLTENNCAYVIDSNDDSIVTEKIEKFVRSYSKMTHFSVNSLNVLQQFKSNGVASILRKTFDGTQF